MTEDEARDIVRATAGGPATERLAALAALVVRENAVQNLVAKSTLGTIWRRHILDSIQLLPLAGSGDWMDIGTGGGFPGLAIAAADPKRMMMLVEPRRLRAVFLRQAAETLGLDRVDVRQTKVEQIDRKAAVISARAVARPAMLLHAAAKCAQADTRWLLFRGAVAESAELEQTGMMFHVKQSVTDSGSTIAVMTGVPR